MTRLTAIRASFTLTSVQETTGRAVVSQYYEEIPDFYRCKACGARNRKLWRRWRGEANLCCADCAGRQQRVSIETLDESGRLIGRNGRLTDQIGLYIPAIPINDESGFYWEYKDIPEDARGWWEQLPLRAS